MEEDTEAALEWAEWKASLCSGCGHPKTESFDEANRDAYEAVPLQCHACAARDAEHRRSQQERSKKSYTESSFDGLYVAVTERGTSG